MHASQMPPSLATSLQLLPVRDGLLSGRTAAALLQQRKAMPRLFSSGPRVRGSTHTLQPRSINWRWRLRPVWGRGGEHATPKGQIRCFPAIHYQKLPTCMNHVVSIMEKLDRILESVVASQGESAGHGKLLGAAFVVVNKDGMKILLTYWHAFIHMHSSNSHHIISLYVTRAQSVWFWPVWLTSQLHMYRCAVSWSFRTHPFECGFCQSLRGILRVDHVHDQDRDCSCCDAACGKWLDRTGRRRQTPSASVGRGKDPQGFRW